jgi:4-hydroxybenzoate polyprenyltransferase
MLRPHQWTKNAVVLAGVVFGGKAADIGPLTQAVVAMVAFCLASSAVYVFNDWHDRDEDRIHPTKRRRPIASGDVHEGMALTIAVASAVLAVGMGFAVRPALAAILLGYLALMMVYTVLLRQVPVLDVVVIAIGFVLRALAGAVAVHVPLSTWLFVCTLLLSLLLGLGKRRHELAMLRGDTRHHRPSLAGYATIDLDRIMVVVTALTASAYFAYTLAVPSFGRAIPMVVTLPFVIVALVRYLFLVFRRNLGGNPEVLLIRDRPLLASICLWAMTVSAVLAS